MGAELVASALTISIGIVRPFARKFAFELCLLWNQEVHLNQGSIGNSGCAPSKMCNGKETVCEETINSIPLSRSGVRVHCGTGRGGTAVESAASTEPPDSCGPA